MKNISAKNADVLAEHFSSLAKLAGLRKRRVDGCRESTIPR